MKGLSVSVVIPAYKAAGTIGRAIDSLLGQTRPPEEILVVDDGSPDDTAAVVSAYGPHVTLVSKENGGVAGARNLGIERSGGDVVAFLDADDYWEPQKLQRQLDVLSEHPQVGLVASWYYIEEPGAPRVPAARRGGALFDRPLTATGAEVFEAAGKIWTSAVLIRRDVLGGNRFAAQFEPAEDKDLWVRMVLARPIYLSSEPLCTAVMEPGSLSRKDVDYAYSPLIRIAEQYADVLGGRGRRTFEARVFRGWAAAHLYRRQPRNAVKPAWNRLLRDPLTAEGWWVLLKSIALGAVA